MPCGTLFSENTGIMPSALQDPEAACQVCKKRKARKGMSLKQCIYHNKVWSIIASVIYQ